jgi:acetylglutamate kinase
MEKLLIKVGGEISGDTSLAGSMALELEELQAKYLCLLVHGGGAELSGLMRRVGAEPRFRDGVRMTTPQEMAYVDMVLSGQVNKRLVRLFQATGINAVGLSGSDGRLFQGAPIAEGSRTGTITQVDTSLLELLLQEGYFPVVSPTSMDAEAKRGLNINADSVAFALAAELRARILVFISDIPGVLKDGQPIASLTITQAMAEIESGTITGGMIPKVQASAEALGRGVERIVIGEYRNANDLRRLVSGEIGTQIVSEKTIKEHSK